MHHFTPEGRGRSGFLSKILLSGVPDLRNENDSASKLTGDLFCFAVSSF
jgi:hypothetical protein